MTQASLKTLHLLKFKRRHRLTSCEENVLQNEIAQAVFIFHSVT